MLRRLVTPDLVISLIFLAVGLSALSQARDWPFRAGLFPLATSFVLTVAALIKVVADLVTAWRRPVAAAAQVHVEHVEDEATEPDLVDVFETATRAQWLESLGWMTAFFAMLWLLGTLVTVPLFAVIYLLVVSKASIRLAAIYALACWLFIYGLFIRLLHIPLPTSALLDFFGS